MGSESGSRQFDTKLRTRVQVFAERIGYQSIAACAAANADTLCRYTLSIESI
jgi:hypothetical protein